MSRPIFCVCLSVCLPVFARVWVGGGLDAECLECLDLLAVRSLEPVSVVAVCTSEISVSRTRCGTSDQLPNPQAARCCSKSTGMEIDARSNHAVGEVCVGRSGRHDARPLHSLWKTIEWVRLWLVMPRSSCPPRL